MKTIEADAERERFETFITTEGGYDIRDIGRNGDSYKSLAIDNAWQGWIARAQSPVADAQRRDDTGRLTSDYEPTAHEIKVARDAICREFGNNGTDGYYIRILKAIHGAAPVVAQAEAKVQPVLSDNERVVRIDGQGVSFGKYLWLSHEKITGRTAEELNAGKGPGVKGYLDWLESAAPAPQAEAKVSDELVGVAEVIAEGGGFWRTCSGCHETVDGHPVGHYPYSKVMKCDLGAGCGDCGGIGAVWDNTDYEAMGRDIEAHEAGAIAAPSDAGDGARPTSEQITHHASLIAGSLLGQASEAEVEDVATRIREMLDQKVDEAIKGERT